jgi:hypothetical protein
MLPDRVAKLQGEHEGGFVIRDPNSGGLPRTISKVEEMMAYISALPVEIVSNGIWIVYTHPAAYSKGEQRKLADLIAKCQETNVPVFCCRASELPHGWKSHGFESEEG